MKLTVPRGRAHLEDLEPRILFSADTPVALVGAALQQPDAAHTQLVQAQPVVQHTANELVFIDSHVQDAQQLADDVAAQAAAGRSIEAVMLDANSDGIAQISAALAERSGVTAIHLVAHGADATLTLGNTALDSNTLLMRAGEIAGWGSHLSADADLLIYGCDFAAQPDGQALVQGLAHLTGTDVAASNDLTGASALGGNWKLEVTSGHIESALAIDAIGQRNFDQVLATYTVTTTSDSGAGSLRQAITNANSNGGTDTINFAIAGTGVHTIVLSTALPTITGTVLLDATTDDSFAPNGNKPAIGIDGGGGTFNGLELTSTADGSTIRGLVLRNFHGNGIQIDSGSDGNTIAGNFIGQMTTSGTVGGSGNTGDGIFVLGASNVIGGTTTLDRNVVSGNSFGIEINGSAATGNQVMGNYIGIDATGLTTLGNTTRGVGVFNGATGNTIGGSSTTQRNIIAGNANDGINIDGETSDNNIARGNWIGIAADGSTLLRNGGDGIYISNGADNTQLGGSGANDGNWIAGITYVGIELDGASTGTVVQGNRIGTDLAGTANWGMGQNGILLETGYSGAGPSASSITGNTIAFSGQSNTAGYNSGVRISDTAGTANTLSANSIYSSVGPGIDLRGDGVTANDSGDADTGANNLQNFPVLTLAKTDASNQLTISGALNSTASSYFRIEFFASPSADTTGYGEGQTYLGFANVATNGSGNATISATLTGVNVPVGYVITATATAANSSYTTFTDTSEFAKNIVAIPTTQATIVVDTTIDTIDGDTTSLSTLLANKGADGFVSLREAITATNNTANGTGGADRIQFGIAGTGVNTITLTSVLPTITDAVLIDATTDDSFATNGNKPAVVLDLANIAASNGLQLTSTADGSTVRGLVIGNYKDAGIRIDSGSDGNTIAGNYLGAIDASGSQTAFSGTYGVYVGGANNIIGGSAAADRNVTGNASSASAYGVIVTGAAATGNQILGNYLGLNAAGTASLTGVQNGILISTSSASNLVQNNVVSGNSGYGIRLTSAGSGNSIDANRIGISASAALIGSPSASIYNESGNGNSITGNWMGGGTIGIWLGVSVGNMTVQGNRIGTDLAGTANWGTQGNGINLQSGNNNNLIGGTGAGQGNVIAYANQGGTTKNGIQIFSGTGNALLGNSIYGVGGSSGLGIQLGSSGVVANDTGDADTGANNLQNFPLLTLAKTNGSSQVSVAGTLNSTANSYLRIEFFASASANATGYGDGQVYLGYLDVATNGSGDASFSTTLSAAVPVGYAITATATQSNAGYSAYTDTSGFSAALAAGTTPVNTVPGAKTVTEDVSGAIAGLSVVDGGALAMTTSLSVLNGTLNVSLAGGATIASGSNNSAALTISGTTAQVNAALATLSYLGGANYNGSDTLTMLSTDASALSDSDTVAITVTAVNDAPVLGAIAPTLTTINEDATTNLGQTVASFVGASVTDVDTGALQGIAITGLVSNSGTWQYSTNGGSSWSAVGTVSSSSALLLRSTDYVRFVPDGQNATTGSLTYRAWDQTSGSTGTKVDASSNGSTTAFSTASDTASITVTAVNDAPVLTAIAPTLITINEDQTANAGQTVASFIGASITDVDTGAVQGIAITSLVSNTGTWQYSTNGGTSWTAVGAVSGSSALLLRSTDYVRFVPDGQNATTGSITYRAWDTTSGSFGTKVDASTNGSTTAFSAASDTASITVTAVNDAPVLTAIAPTLTTINEDATNNSGQTVALFFGASIADVDAGAVQGIAITSLTSGTGTWQYSTNAGSSWSAIGTVTGASALLLRSNDYVRFVPDGQNATTGSMTYRAWDQTSGSTGTKVDTSTNGSTTAFSTASDTASITVTAVNDAPVLTAIAPTLTTINEDATTNVGQTVASFLGASITDVDAGAVQGIAITSLASGTGTWQYSTNGGSSWTAVGAVNGTSALLLRSNDYVRFVPDGLNATTGSMTYRAWDQTSGSTGTKVDASTNGGTTAFSTASDTASITVTAVNDAPVLTAIAPTLTTITEDQTANAGQTVASLIGASIADVDSGAMQGIAITSLVSNTGTWQYSTNAGSSWSAIGTVTGASALLLRSNDYVRFVPDGQNATTGSITYRGWDETSGSTGTKVDASTNGGTTAFSTAGDTASITVTAVNDAPVLTAIAPTLTTINEDATTNVGQTVASFLGASITDVDAGAVQGIAITSLTSGTGTWQYSTNGGSSWTAVGAVNGTSALLLRSTDYVRFVPDGQNATTGSMTYRAWDTTSGSFGTKVDASTNGSTTSFSSASDTASLTVSAVNDAPILTLASPTLATITEDQTANAGQTVASLIGASISDVDTSAVQGIAITSIASGTGTWQYSTNGGTSWTAVGALSGSSALLLRSTDYVRFVPDGQNATTGSITYRGWDQTSGSTGAKVDVSTNGGTTAFSTTSDTASITVTAVNDAPVLTPAAPTLTTINEDQTANVGQIVASLVGASISDVDTSAVQGIAITSIATGTGTWQYSTDAGSSWSAAGTVSGSSALLLRSTDYVRFVPDGLNSTSGSLTYRAWDQTSGSAGAKVDASANGTTTAFSLASDTASITVTDVNDAPVLNAIAPTLSTLTEDQTTNGGQTVAAFVGASITDVDIGAVQGIAITGLFSGLGSWQYSTDGSSTWIGVGAVSDSSALLLRASDSLRFVPDGQDATTGSITYRAWDTSSGSVGSKVDASTGGTTTAFSLASDTASVAVTAVNDAPVTTPIAPTLTTITEHQTTNTGQTVGSFLGASITDVDTGAVQGIAVTALTSGTGNWQFSTDGGASWSAIGTVSGASALLLRSTDYVRFVPDGLNSTTGSLTYRAWDETSGSTGTKVDASTSGGTTAFSTTSDTASINVTAVNDAPVLVAIAPTLATINEDATNNGGQTVAAFIGASIAEVDTGAVQGIAITGLFSNTGTWQYSTNAGSSWLAIGTVTGTSALLLRSNDYLRLVPDAQNATTGSITYRAWDQTSGSTGTKVDASTNGSTTAFSTTSDTASISVTAVNDAPVLTAIAPTLTTINEDATTNVGQTVASFIGASVTDVDTGAVQGIAITGLVSNAGNWQFSIDGGASWSAIGTVSGASALLLRSTDSVRLVPDDLNATSGSITYRGWDQTSGSTGTKVDASTNGGTTAFSSASDTASIAVTAVNDAPVLTAIAPTLTTINEDGTTNVGQTVASFIGASVTDVDTGSLQGIAITGLVSNTGTWEYSIDAGGTWNAVGALSDTLALLLRSTDSVRFVPDGNNATTGSITYRAWDQTSGSIGTKADTSVNGGMTAFSTAGDTASITVTAVNDAPVLTSAGPTLATITEDQAANAGQTVASFVGVSITDIDTGGVQGIAINGLISGTGTWQYSTNGGSSWTNIGTVSDSSALLLSSTDSVRFVPDGLNATTGSITYLAWDQTSGSAGIKFDASTSGGTTAFSTASATASIMVTAVNDAPVLVAIAPTLTTINEDATTNVGQTVASFIGASVTDVDTGAVQGIAITGLVSNAGTWQFSIDGGASWSALGAVSDSSALLLRSNDVVRFVPDGQNATTGSLTYHAWDTASGSAGSKVSTASNGGTTAFSVATDTASITVTATNDAPVTTPIAPTLNPITEDQTADAGQTVASFLGASITDVDSGAMQGIAITGLFAGDGSWQFSTDGGSNWTNVGAVGNASALLLRASDSVRFVPDGQNATSGSITYRAWDTASGSAGSKVSTAGNGGTTAFSVATDTASITVTAVNDAPVTTPVAPTVTTLTEDQSNNAGQTVASIIGTSITDVDNGAVQGIAITGLASGNGTWQYSTDGGSNWSAIGTVSDGAALLLRATDSVRFLPDGQNSTSASIAYRAWDQSSGVAGGCGDASANGGSSAFSLTTDTASITVSATNDAPVLNPAQPTLATLAADQTTNAGQSVESIVGNTITDADAGALQGIAITATRDDISSSGSGAWQYSLDNGSTWSAIGAVSDTSGLLLRPTDLVRLVPDGTHGGAASLTYRAWDQTTGSAGGRADAQAGPQATSGFSVASDTASITVTAVTPPVVVPPVVVPPPIDHAPVITSNGGGSTAAISVAENTSAVTVVQATDADAPTQTLGFAITGGADAALFSIDAQTGALAFATAPDFEAPRDAGANNVYELIVQASDGALAITQALAVTVVNVNDNAPQITSNGGGASAAVAVVEGHGGVTQLTASDADAPLGTLAFSIVGGADAARFAIDATTGDLRFVQAPAFDAAGTNRYNLIVGVSDGTLSRTQALTIDVTARPVTPQPPLPPQPPTSVPPVDPATPLDPLPPAPPNQPITPTAQAAPPTALVPPPQPEATRPVAAATPPTTPIRLTMPIPALVAGHDSGTGVEPISAGRAWVTRSAPAMVLHSIEPLRSVATHEQGAYVAPRALTMQAYFDAMQASASAEHRPDDVQAGPPGDAELGPEASELNIALVGSLAASAGVLLWASRGAALLASLLVSAPAWRGYDLLPVLRRREKSRLAVDRHEPSPAALDAEPAEEPDERASRDDADADRDDDDDEPDTQEASTHSTAAAAHREAETAP